MLELGAAHIKRSARLGAAVVAPGEPALTLLARAMRPRLRVRLALGLLLDVVIADRGGGVERVSDLLLRHGVEEGGVSRIVLRGRRVGDPGAGESVGLEFEPNAV